MSKKRLTLNVLLLAALVLGILSPSIDYSKISTPEPKFVVTIGSLAEASEIADYVADGTADNVQFQQAMDALPSTGGKLRVLGGTYNFAATVTRAIADITIEGVGNSTYFTYNASSAIFTAGGNRWVFKDFRTDAGGVGLGATTGWSIENVTVNTTQYAFRSPSGTLYSAGNSLTFGGAVTTANSFTTVGNYALTLTQTGTTNVTLPTTGTLATLAGSEALTNKTGLSLAGSTPTISQTVDTAMSIFQGGDDYAGRIVLYGKNHATLPGMIHLTTSNAAKNDQIDVFRVAGATDTPLATWGNTSAGRTVNQDFGTAYLQATEMTAPGTGGANTGRLYLEDNGAGKTRLMIIFGSGAAQQIAIEP